MKKEKNLYKKKNRLNVDGKIRSGAPIDINKRKRDYVNSQENSNSISIYGEQPCFLCTRVQVGLTKAISKSEYTYNFMLMMVKWVNKIISANVAQSGWFS